MASISSCLKISTCWIRLDGAFIRFTEDGRLEELDQKWFYPVQDEPQTPVWIWVLGALSLLLLILAVVYLVMVRLKDTRLTNSPTTD